VVRQVEGGTDCGAALLEARGSRMHATRAVADAPDIARSIRGSPSPERVLSGGTTISRPSRRPRRPALMALLRTSVCRRARGHDHSGRRQSRRSSSRTRMTTMTWVLSPAGFVDSHGRP
jgi:hypothetical protein